MDQLIKDVRHSLRALARQPGFTLVAILTLALGMGATTAIFSVVRASLLAPLPWSEPDRRVMIWSRWSGWDKTWVSSAEVRDYRAARSLRGVAAWGSGQANLTGTGEPERVGAGQATANVFDVLGARPLHRPWLPARRRRRRHRRAVVVLCLSLWQRRFGADPSVVGRTIQIDGARLRGHRRHAEGLQAAHRLQRRLRGADRALDAPRARPRSERPRQSRLLRRRRRWLPASPPRRPPRKSPAWAARRRAQGLYPRPCSSSRSRCRWWTKCSRPRVPRWRCSLPRRRCCSSSRARTSPTCCSRGWRAGGASWRCAPRLVPRAGTWLRQLLTETLLARRLAAACSARRSPGAAPRPWPHRASPGYPAPLKCRSMASCSASPHSHRCSRRSPAGCCPRCDRLRSASQSR